ncbi:hypothetical protein SAMN05661091_5714 [Paenibacillus uliginis N3/975]|uniref:Thioredoxin domain-containing protein n=1 Tax=Paenibacillus uliginis N3/975 TaxID=1313296 RepID=A0A1X7HSP5_9BACL|nr:hypothetical protein [Paenibacillus uliginis]SMF92193.1 hypothetical protein SAMN05661091_5714 [Paenibacillus uliginis N3/975]
MNLFNLSYAFLWAIIALQSYFIIQFGRKLQAAKSTADAGPGLIEEDHGLPKRALFPQFQFESVNKGLIDLKQLGKQKHGFLIAFTDAKCTSCKELYPVLERFHQQSPQFQSLILMVGQEPDVVEIINQYGLTVPVMPIDSPTSFQTGIFPFVYYLSPKGEVIAKSVVQYREQLNALLQQTVVPKAS